MIGLIGCGKGAQEPRVAADGNIHLQYWESFNTEELRAFDALRQRFEQEYAAAHPGEPGIVIDAEAVPFDNMDQQLASAAFAGETPDLVRVDYNKIISLAYGQAAVPLEAIDAFARLFPGQTMDTLRSSFVNAAYDACIHIRRGERHLYALPEQVTCLALCWNKSLFRARRQAIADEARRTGLPISFDQPPHTWDELEALGRALTWTDEGTRRFGFGMRDSLWFALPVLNTYHAEVIHQDPATGALSCDIATDPRAIAALNRMKGFYQGHDGQQGFEGGAWSAGADRTDRGFETGTYAMVMEGVWNLQRWNDAGLDYGVAVIPHPGSEEAARLGIPAEENTTATNLGGAGIVIVRSAMDRGVANEALEFMAWWTSAPIQAEWCRQLGQIPVNLAAQELVEADLGERAGGFLTQSRYARRPPPVPLYGSLELTIFNPNLVLVFQNQLTAEQALGRVQSRIERDILSTVNVE